MEVAFLMLKFQIIFYKILFEEFQKKSAQYIHSAEVSYLDPNSRGEFITSQLRFQSEDVTMVKGLIKNSYEKIMKHEFYEGCGEKNCPWCSFVKQNVTQDSLRDLEVEELDD